MTKTCPNCRREFDAEEDHPEQKWCDECEKGRLLPPIEGTMEIKEPPDSFGNG